MYLLNNIKTHVTSSERVFDNNNPWNLKIFSFDNLTLSIFVNVPCWFCEWFGLGAGFLREFQWDIKGWCNEKAPDLLQVVHHSFPARHSIVTTSKTSPAISGSWALVSSVVVATTCRIASSWTFSCSRWFAACWLASCVFLPTSLLYQS